VKEGPPKVAKKGGKAKGKGKTKVKNDNSPKASVRLSTFWSHLKF